VVLVQSDVEDVVSRSFCQERVTFKELSDDDAEVTTVVHKTLQFTATRIIIGRKQGPWRELETAASLGAHHKTK